MNALFTSLTTDHKLALGQLLNAGSGSAGMMSLNTIVPPLFERENNNIYLVLRGANLDLNKLEMSVEILRTTDNVSVSTTPNSQVTLYADAFDYFFDIAKIYRVDMISLLSGHIRYDDELGEFNF